MRKLLTIVMGLVPLFEPEVLGKALTKDSIYASQITVTSGLSSIYRENNKIFVTPLGETDFIVESLYNPDPKERELHFGSYKSDSDFTRRIPIEKPLSKGYWNSISLWNKGFLLLEGRLGRIGFQNENGRTFLPSDILVDGFRPARDRSGEPIAYDIKNAVNRFVKAYQSFPPSKIKFLDIVSVPPRWLGKRDGQFLLLTDIKGFNIFSVNCELKDGVLCRLRRACNLERGRKAKNADYSSMTVSSKGRKVLLADKRNKRIDVYDFNTCYDIRYRRSMPLPDILHPPTALHIDAENSLWVGTSFRDNYLNASLYKWKEDQWHQK